MTHEHIASIPLPKTPKVLRDAAEKMKTNVRSLSENARDKSRERVQMAMQSGRRASLEMRDAAGQRTAKMTRKLSTFTPKVLIRGTGLIKKL